MNKSRTNLFELISQIEPLDEREQRDLQDIGGWVGSGSEVYRTAKPDVPPKHLAVYFVLVDSARRSLLLMEHVKSGLWLPPGGHVEPEEDPYDATQRELAEELGTKA